MTIDWSVFDKYDEDTALCACGRVYRTHAKSSTAGGRVLLVARKPCPGCGNTEGNLRRVSSDPEYFARKEPKP